MSTIVDVIGADRNLATLLRGVQAAGLEAELTQDGPYTLFAPTDMAFGKLAEGRFTELLKPENKITLEKMLNDHVIEGKTSFKDLKNGQILKTVTGKELHVKIEQGTITINGAKIQGRDSQASNGVVHSLDTVLSLN